jgi:hypothetical protein
VLIAIDLDDTLTADSELWRAFIETASKLGHRCICVTARRDTEGNNDTVDQWMQSHAISLPVYYTGLRSKIEYMAERGVHVDIWIDDDPKRCALGH